MGIASFLRNFIGAAPQADVDAMLDVSRAVVEARAARDEAAQLVRTAAEEQRAVVARVESELTRLSVRVEAMPEMRAQLEQFVHSLGRTMTQAADRLESVDDRMREVEQQSRAHTEILALSRTELDRQGRSVAQFESQMRSLEDALSRMSLASDRVEILVREMEARRRTAARSERLTMIAVVVGFVALLIAFIR